MKISDHIKEELQNLANEEIARHSQRFFKTGKGEYGEGDVFLGIRVPVLRTLVKKHQDITLPQCEILLDSTFHEQRLLALLMMVRLYETANPQEKDAVFTSYTGNTRFINNWDLVDTSAHKIVGAHLLNSNKDILYKFAHSTDMWERRIAIFSTMHFIQNNFFEDTLRVSAILLNDPQDLIHKAVGWMLREIGKRDLHCEEEFLTKHYQQMPRTMLRYAIEKFKESRRQEYLKGSI